MLEPVTVNTDYTDLLPSLSMRMRIAERAALSLGAARVMTHPSFNDLAPGIRYNYSTKTARAGNPYLELFRANQYMAELVWAPLRGQRIRANITYRDVESYFALGEESIEIDDDVFLLTRPINGQAGYILSAGVQFDPNLRRILRSLQDFDLVLAYTHNRSGSDMHDPYTGRELPLPNTAEYVAKADLVYSKNTFSGRLSYQWRGQSLKASSSDSGLSVWNRPVGSLNLNLGWQLNKSLQFNLDGRNLLAEDQLQTTDDDGQIGASPSATAWWPPRFVPGGEINCGSGFSRKQKSGLEAAFLNASKSRLKPLPHLFSIRHGKELGVGLMLLQPHLNLRHDMRVVLRNVILLIDVVAVGQVKQVHC